MHFLASYAIAIAAVFAVAYFPSRVTGAATKSTWYECIRPSITPPRLVFPIAWSILYVLLAITMAETLRMRQNSWLWHALIAGYVVNLALNALWSYLYFGKRDVWLAFLVILLLWGSILFLIVATFMVAKKWMGYLLMPYLFWVTFATILNALSLPKAKACKGV